MELNVPYLLPDHYYSKFQQKIKTKTNKQKTKTNKNKTKTNKQLKNNKSIKQTKEKHKQKTVVLKL
jgi:hypothetical protein